MAYGLGEGSLSGIRERLILSHDNGRKVQISRATLIHVEDIQIWNSG